MTPDAALKHIRQALVDNLGVPAERVVPEATLRDDLEMDSLDMVELVTIVESELDRNLESAQLEDVRTVADVVDLVLSLAPAGRGEDRM